MSRLLFALPFALLVPGCWQEVCQCVDAPDTPIDDAPIPDVAIEGDSPTLDTPEIADAPTSDAPTDCAAQDARGEGACDAVLGVVWLGSYCTAISGCSCVGDDCGALYADLTACQQAHRACPRSCGGLTPGGTPGCLPDEYCDYAVEEMCGAFDAPGDCQPRPTECLEPGGVPVCGCDGTEYLNECLANMAGTGVGRLGGCP